MHLELSYPAKRRRSRDRSRSRDREGSGDRQGTSRSHSKDRNHPEPKRSRRSTTPEDRTPERSSWEEAEEVEPEPPVKDQRSTEDPSQEPVEESHVELLEEDEPSQTSMEGEESSPLEPEEEEFNPRDYYELEETGTTRTRRGGMFEKRWKIKMTKAPGGSSEEGHAAIELIIKDAFKQALSKADPRSRVQITASHPDFNTSHVSTKMRLVGEMSVEELLDRVESIIQSPKEGEAIMLEDVEWSVLVVTPPPSAGGPVAVHLRHQLDLKDIVCLLDQWGAVTTTTTTTTTLDTTTTGAPTICGVNMRVMKR